MPIDILSITAFWSLCFGGSLYAVAVHGMDRNIMWWAITFAMIQAYYVRDLVRLNAALVNNMGIKLVGVSDGKPTVGGEKLDSAEAGRAEEASKHGPQGQDHVQHRAGPGFDHP